MRASWQGQVGCDLAPGHDSDGGDRLFLVDAELQTSYDEAMPQTRRNPENSFGGRVRELRQAKHLTLRDVAGKVGINFTYLSKIENGKLDFSDYPSEKLIRKLAKALGGDTDEFLLLAEKVPDRIRKRVLERPDAFGRLAGLDDETLDRLVAQIGDQP
jgi:transcriptional regulator with XRE-family HTH domain